MFSSSRSTPGGSEHPEHCTGGLAAGAGHFPLDLGWDLFCIFSLLLSFLQFHLIFISCRYFETAQLFGVTDGCPRLLENPPVSILRTQDLWTAKSSSRLFPQQHPEAEAEHKEQEQPYSIAET